MNNLPLENRTRVLSAPEGWDQSKQQCVALDITDVKTPNGPFMVSAWCPSEWELAALRGGSPLFLWIGGTNHPPVAMTVDNPPSELRMTAEEATDSEDCAVMLACLRTAQLEKLKKARDAGQHGWRQTAKDTLLGLLQCAVADEDWASVANYAGMLNMQNLDAR